MKNKQQLHIVSIKYNDDENARNKLAQFVIECILEEAFSGGETYIEHKQQL